MLEIPAGQVLVDDADIMSLEPDYVRDRLVAVPQDIVIFEATVRLNLDPQIPSKTPRLSWLYEKFLCGL